VEGVGVYEESRWVVLSTELLRAFFCSTPSPSFLKFHSILSYSPFIFSSPFSSVFLYRRGGAIVWYVAAAYPELVSGLVSLCGPHPLLFQRNLSLRQLLKSYYMFVFQAPLLPEIWLSSFDYRLAEAFRAPPGGCVRAGAVTDEDIERYKQNMGQPGALTAMINYYRAMIRDPAREMARKLKAPLAMPVLCAAATRDMALEPGMWRGCEGLGPDVRFELMRDCSHWAPQVRYGGQGRRCYIFTLRIRCCDVFFPPTLRVGFFALPPSPEELSPSSMSALCASCLFSASTCHPLCYI
jgi:hypothetical protein